MHDPQWDEEDDSFNPDGGIVVIAFAIMAITEVLVGFGLGMLVAWVFGMFG